MDKEIDESVFDNKNVHIHDEEYYFKIGQSATLGDILREHERYEGEKEGNKNYSAPSNILKKEESVNNIEDTPKKSYIEPKRNALIGTLLLGSFITKLWFFGTYGPIYPEYKDKYNLGESSKMLVMPVNMHGGFIEGPYKRTSLNHVINKKIKTHICNYFCEKEDKK